MTAKEYYKSKHGKEEFLCKHEILRLMDGFHQHHFQEATDKNAHNLEIKRSHEVHLGIPHTPNKNSVY
jgi:hypothetical protein